MAGGRGRPWWPATREGAMAMAEPKPRTASGEGILGLRRQVVSGGGEQ